MAIKLTWDDLLIQNISPEEASQWMAEWPPLVTGPFHPMFMSRFGDWFLRRPDGTTELLDVLEGTLTKIAETPDEFGEMVNDIPWQEERLLSPLVYQLHEEGKIPADRQCYGFAPHPALSGQIDREQAMIFDVIVWQSICSQTLFPKE